MDSTTQHKTSGPSCSFRLPAPSKPPAVAQEANKEGEACSRWGVLDPEASGPRSKKPCYSVCLLASSGIREPSEGRHWVSVFSCSGHLSSFESGSGG